MSLLTTVGRNGKPTDDLKALGDIFDEIESYLFFSDRDKIKKLSMERLMSGAKKEKEILQDRMRDLESRVKHRTLSVEPAAIKFINDFDRNIHRKRINENGENKTTAFDAALKGRHGEIAAKLAIILHVYENLAQSHIKDITLDTVQAAFALVEAIEDRRPQSPAMEKEERNYCELDERVIAFLNGRETPATLQEIKKATRFQRNGKFYIPTHARLGNLAGKGFITGEFQAEPEQVLWLAKKDS